MNEIDNTINEIKVWQENHKFDEPLNKVSIRQINKEMKEQYKQLFIILIYIMIHIVFLTLLLHILYYNQHLL
jgi:hypothetical protein